MWLVVLFLSLTTAVYFLLYSNRLRRPVLT